MSDDVIEFRDTKGRFLSGTKPGPGRKAGGRNQLATDFIEAVAADFAEHGLRVIEQVRHERPEIWLKIVSDLLPKEATDKIQGVGNLFAGCESIGEVVTALLGELGIDEALEMCDTFKAELLRTASDQAMPVS